MYKFEKPLPCKPLKSFSSYLIFDMVRDSLFLRYKKHRWTIWTQKSFARIAYYGVANEKDESKEKYVIQMNLISFATFVINFITGLLFFFIAKLSPGVSFILSAMMWLLPIYINRKGLKLISRTLLVFLTLSALLIASCWYTHNTMLDSYFLIVAINTNFMYSTGERKWALASTFLSLMLFIIESTSLQNYLPAYNTLSVTPGVNIILLFGAIMTILVDVTIYAYINRLRENNLLTKQKELEETQRKVQIQNDDLKTFSIAASHSMQTPLYVSSFFLEKVKNEIYQLASDDSKQSIELIQNGLKQMEVLVSGLFSYNRIINIEHELVQIDVLTEINLIKASIVPRYPNANITIISNGHMITTNPLLFSIILSNLIDNALKYNHSKQPSVTIEVNKRPNRLILLVKDNGIGIPENYFSTIFEPFKRVQINTLIKPGNGLGLAGAKRAAERISGNLICEKSDHNGSVFKFEIPLK